jgi:phage protein D
MFNYIKVNFTEIANKPAYVYSATLYQDRYKHELVELQFKDWEIDYDNVAPGSPCEIDFRSTKSSKKFYGYVHHIEPYKAPGSDVTTVLLIGASYVMKATRQEVYRNTTADQVIKTIASSHGFSCYAEPLERVYPQISQSGQSDWELICRLAKQNGYTVRVENTELYFQPVLYEYTEYRESAPVFTMRSAQSIYGSSMYSFEPLIGETLEYEDTLKAAVAVSGVDLNTSALTQYTPPKKAKATKAKSKQEFFDGFDNKSVALDTEVAKFEADAAEARNSFPYRATIEVLGNLDVRPNHPIYLNGLGNTYSGYWTVLKATHKIIETDRNIFKYTTVAEIGTDSLGNANKWIDGQIIDSPSALSKRVIKSNVRQTKKVPKTLLKSTSKIKAPQSKAPFSSVKNRVVTKTASQSKSPTVWKSDSYSNNKTFVEKNTSAAVKARIGRS